MRLIHRLRLACWAFANPDNLTMFRHELATKAAEGAEKSARYKAAKAQGIHAQGATYHETMCGYWVKRYLDLPVR